MPIRAPAHASSSKMKKQPKKKSLSSKSTAAASVGSSKGTASTNTTRPSSAASDKSTCTPPPATEKKSDTAVPNRSGSHEKLVADTSTSTTKMKTTAYNNDGQQQQKKKQQEVEYGSYSLAEGPPWSSKDRFLANALAKAAAKRNIKLQMSESLEDSGKVVSATTVDDPNWGYPNGNSADADSVSIADSFSVPPMKEEPQSRTSSPLTDDLDLVDESELTPRTSPPKLKERDAIHASPNNSGGCPFLHHQKIHLEQLETGEKISVQPSEATDIDKPRHAVGCTPHECHGAMMDKTGFAAVGDSYSQPIQTKIDEAVAFIRQFAEETSHFATPQDLEGRIFDVTNDIQAYGSYRHTHEELEFGCRLAWRNSGRCIMRKVSFNLELRDCRNAKTSKECFDQIIDHLHYAGNDGAIKPVISVFPQKGDGISAPVRVWNRQLIGYAAYQRKDGSVMGDPVNLSFTGLCVKLGWTPPTTKSDFDVLPLIISDNIIGHDRPQVFEIPTDAILEVPIHHPEHELFSSLNLRWYALPAISNMGIDIGGVCKSYLHKMRLVYTYKFEWLFSSLVKPILSFYEHAIESNLQTTKPARSMGGIKSPRLAETFSTSSAMTSPRPLPSPAASSGRRSRYGGMMCSFKFTRPFYIHLPRHRCPLSITIPQATPSLTSTERRSASVESVRPTGYGSHRQLEDP